MKIVHLIGYFQPEFGYKEYYIARNQAKAGHEVHVITSDRVFPFPDYSRLAKEIGVSASRARGVGESKIDGILVHRQKTLFELKEFILIRGVKKLLKKINPDIVHAYAPNQVSTVFGALHKKELGYFLIGDDQVFTKDGRPIPYSSIQGMIRYNLFQSHLSQFYFDRCDVIFCPNTASRDYIDKKFRVGSKTKVVPIGFDPDFYHFNQRARETIRKKYGIRQAETTVLLVGRLTSDKGFDRVIELAKELLKKSTAKILIVGDGSFKNELERQVKTLVVSDKVFFAGFVPEQLLYHYYSAADIGVWPKRPSVGISNAIGCELPVLVPNDAMMNHLVSRGNGLAFEPSSESDLFDKLNFMITSREGIIKMRKSAKKFASDTLSYEKLALKDIEAYEEYKRLRK